MPRQKKVQEVPVETVNQIGQSLAGAQEALSQMSYGQVMMLSEETQKHIDSAVVEVNRAMAYFTKLYVTKKQPAQPAPRRTGKKKIHAVLENGGAQEI